MLFRSGLAKDEAEAVRLYRLAAAQGHASAQYSLGFAYMNGQGGLASRECKQFFKNSFQVRGG